MKRTRWYERVAGIAPQAVPYTPTLASNLWMVDVAKDMLDAGPNATARGRVYHDPSWPDMPWVGEVLHPENGLKRHGTDRDRFQTHARAIAWVNQQLALASETKGTPA